MRRHHPSSEAHCWTLEAPTFREDRWDAAEEMRARGMGYLKPLRSGKIVSTTWPNCGTRSVSCLKPLRSEKIVAIPGQPPVQPPQQT